MGKSNSPVHQTSQGRIHPHRNGQNPENNTDNSAWELAQTRDPRGINNFHQNSNGKLVMASGGRPKCNYCEKPNHGRQRCAFRLADLEHNIDRQFHPQKGSLGKTDTKSYIPKQNRGHRSPMSTRLANETDNSGHPRFWQTQCGHIIYSIDNQPQCSYCGIPSHGKRHMSTQTQRQGWGSISHTPPTKGSNTTNRVHSTRIILHRYGQTFKLGRRSGGTQLSTDQERQTNTQPRRSYPMQLLRRTKSPSSQM